jgi:hypothetical protein
LSRWSREEEADTVDPSNVHARLLETRFTLAAGGDQIRELSAGEAGEGLALAAVLVSGSESGEATIFGPAEGNLGRAGPGACVGEDAVFALVMGGRRGHAAV